MTFSITSSRKRTFASMSAKTNLFGAPRRNSFTGGMQMPS